MRINRTIKHVNNKAEIAHAFNLRISYQPVIKPRSLTPPDVCHYSGQSVVVAVLLPTQSHRVTFITDANQQTKSHFTNSGHRGLWKSLLEFTAYRARQSHPCTPLHTSILHPREKNVASFTFFLTWRRQCGGDGGDGGVVGNKGRDGCRLSSLSM